MDLQEVLVFISSGEGQCIEFKESFAEENDAIISLCAFSHAEGGIVLFGVSDDGRPKGISLGKNTLEQFAQKLRNCVEPSITAGIQQFLIAGKNIVCVNVNKTQADRVSFAFGKAYIRVGKTNQLMSSNEIRDRFFSGFKAENFDSQKTENTLLKTESWNEREKRRCYVYENNRGLFLVHKWRPSQEPGQIADIVISLTQHGEGPLTQGIVKSVEYHLGPNFFKQTVVKTESDNNYRLEVSAYGPMLCLARVNFDDGSPSLNLQRYIDFWPESNQDTWALEKTANVIRELLQVLEYVNENRDLGYKLPWGETIKEEIENRITVAFYDLTKLLSSAFSLSGNWTPNDRDLLLKHGKEGLEKLIDLYSTQEHRYDEYLEGDLPLQ
ncbi:RNA-binding domain-containing protein [Chloroflexota bacterium]